MISCPMELLGELLYAAEERDRLQAEIVRRGRGCAVSITGDPEDADGLELDEALLAIDECIRLGKEAHNDRVRLQAEVERLERLSLRYLRDDMTIPHDWLAKHFGGTSW